MEKNKLLLFPFLVGILLMIYSWYLSYPLSIDSVDDLVFNHVSVIYWISLPILLTSMYMIALTSKNNYLKWIMAVGIGITIYSLSYFYYMLPGSDDHYFRGVTEYFLRTKNLQPSILSHMYFQWPSFFILADIATSVSGLELKNFQFLQYTIIGFLLATTLYVYASKVYKKSGFVAVVVFFIATIGYINYQNAPFSLALGLLFLLFMLETRQKSPSLNIVKIILFINISITHAFVPLFYILYLLIQSIVKRKSEYRGLFLLTLSSYFIVQVTLGQFSFANNIIAAITSPAEYSNLVSQTLATVSHPIDVTAQVFSRTVIIATVMICVAGFVLLLIKRKTRGLDKAIFLVGTIYSGVGIVLYTLGTRAIPVAFIPISLGAAYLFESKIGRYMKCLFLILLALSVLITLHASFYDSEIMFQTREAYATENFMINKYDWNATSLILSHVSTKYYILTQINGNALIADDASISFHGLNIETYDCIIYEVGLAKTFQKNNVSTEEASRLILDRFNVIYNSGFSYIAKKSR